MSIPDNSGLEIPIDALRLINMQYSTPTTGLSQADIWALAGLTGAEISQTRPSIMLFPLQFIGRIYCNGPLDRGPV